jgi:hypothetical protein
MEREGQFLENGDAQRRYAQMSRPERIGVGPWNAAWDAWDEVGRDGLRAALTIRPAADSSG